MQPGPRDPCAHQHGEELIADQGKAELTCQFCDKVYHYSKEDLEAILAGM